MSVWESLAFIDSAFGTKFGSPRGLIFFPFLAKLFLGTFSSLSLSSIFSRSWTSSSKYHLFVSLISNFEMSESQFLSCWWSLSSFFGTFSGSKHDRLFEMHFLKIFCENFELGRILVRDDFSFYGFSKLQLSKKNSKMSLVSEVIPRNETVLYAFIFCACLHMSPTVIKIVGQIRAFPSFLGFFFARRSVCC